MKNLLLSIFMFLLVSSSCQDDALFNSGIPITKTFELPEFTTIEAESTFELELVTDTTNEISITCGENLQKNIHIEVKDNILYLKHDIKNNWSRQYEKVKLKLHSKPFETINVRQPIRIFNQDVFKGSVFSIVDWGKFTELDLSLDVDVCLIDMSTDNFGQFKVKGKANYTQILCWGSSKVSADSLITSNCYVLHNGIGNVYVNATNQLDVEIDFSGNVFYSGIPSKINLFQSKGTGNLFKK